MSNKAFEYYKELPSWAKGVVVIGVLGIGYIIISKLYKGVKEQQKSADQRRTNQAQLEEKRNLENLGMRLTYPKSQYKAWADAIQTQLSGCDPLEHSMTVIGNAIGKLKNDLDFLELSTAWGVSRTYDQCGWGMGDFTGSFQQAVNDELRTVEINILNKDLASKGISYRFN